MEIHAKNNNIKEFEVKGLEVALPGIILLMAFLLKLFIDRTAKLPDVIAAILELPVDVAFLATTLVAAFTISTKDAAANGLVAFAVYVIGAILIVVLWRRSHRSFEADAHLTSIVLAIASYIVCAIGLVNAISMIKGR